MQRSILIVTNRPPWPLQDGGALAMHQVITGYKAQGWAVHLLSMNTHRHQVEENDLRTAYASIDTVAMVPFDNRLRASRIVRNFLTSRQPEHAERFYDKAFERALVETLRRVQPDVVQMESLFLTSYLPAICAISSAALVLRMHNVEHQIWRRAANEAAGAKRIYLRSLAQRMKRYEACVWKQYDLLLPITPDDAEAVQDTGCRTPLHLTPFGIDVKEAPVKRIEASTAAPQKFYHLGAMDWLPNREGVAWFIRDAWPLIRAVLPSAEFHFGGRLLEENFAAPLPAGVFNHGPVKDAVQFAAEMDALVVPLRAGGGIRIKILEAMAAGKMVISTGIGIQGIGATRGVHFLCADTPPDFALAAEHLAAHPEKCSRMAAAASDLVRKQYDAQTIAARLSERVLKLIKQRH